MKYVIFKRGEAVLEPVIMPDHVTHSSVTIEGATPIRAGFFTLSDRFGCSVNSWQRSESLNLGPDQAADERLLNATLQNFGMYAFTAL